MSYKIEKTYIDTNSHGKFKHKHTCPSQKKNQVHIQSKNIENMQIMQNTWTSTRETTPGNPEVYTFSLAGYVFSLRKRVCNNNKIYIPKYRQNINSWTDLGCHYCKANLGTFIYQSLNLFIYFNPPENHNSIW